MGKIAMLIMVMVFYSQCSVGQSIYGEWKSVETENYHLTMELNESGYSSVEGHEKIKIKIRGDKLKIMDYYNPKALFFGKDVYRFDILELTQDRLVICQDNKKQLFMEINDSIISFVRKGN